MSGQTTYWEIQVQGEFGEWVPYRYLDPFTDDQSAREAFEAVRHDDSRPVRLVRIETHVMDDRGSNMKTDVDRNSAAPWSPIFVKFLFHDPSQSHNSYDFQCGMKGVPRIGDSVLLPSADACAISFEDEQTGLTAFSARVKSVDWVPAQREVDGPDVIIEADFEWV